MALPRQLKRMNVFVDGVSYLGETKTFTRPKLTRKMEDWKGGGLDGVIKIDMGQEPIEANINFGGLMPDIRAKFGATTVDAVQLRFAGAFDNSQGGVDAVEIVVRGRIEEIEAGEDETGKMSEEKVKLTCVYYKETVNGTDLIEIDVLNTIMIVNGNDVLAAQRNASGG